MTKMLVRIIKSGELRTYSLKESIGFFNWLSDVEPFDIIEIY